MASGTSLVFDLVLKDKNFKVTLDTETDAAGKLSLKIREITDVAQQAQNQLNKVKNGFEKTTKSATKKTGEEAKGIMGIFKRISIFIRSMHLHGLEKITNKFARFFSVIGGAGITGATLLTTAFMGLFLVIKTKVIPIMIESTQKIIDRIHLLTDQIKSNINKLKKEREEYNRVFDQLIKINEKQKISTTEQFKQQQILTEIKNKWGEINVQIDKSTGKIKNLNELLALQQNKNIKQLDKNYTQMIQFGYTEADMLLSQLTGHKYKKLKTMSQNDIENLQPADFFPWLQEVLNKEDLQKIDLKKLVFGDIETRKSFFYDLGRVTKDPKAFEQIKKVIAVLQNISQWEKERADLFNPEKGYKKRAESLTSQVDELNKTRQDAEKRYAEVIKQSEKKKAQINNEWTERSLEEQEQDQMQQLTEEKAQHDKLVAEQMEQMKEMDKIDFEDLDSRIKNMTKNNTTLQNLHNQLEKVDEKYASIYQDAMQVNLNKLMQSKEIVKDYERRLKNSPQAMAVPTKKVIEAQSYINDYEGFVRTFRNENESNRQAERKRIREEWYKANDTSINSQFDKLEEEIGNARTIITNVTTTTEQINKSSERIADGALKLQQIKKSIAENLQKQRQAYIKEAEQLEKELQERAKIQKQRNKYLAGIGNDVISQLMKDTGQQRQLIRQQTQREIMQALGVTKLNKRQKRIAARYADIKMMQQENESYEASTFKYGVKTNALAARGGWNSSVYVSGRDNLMQQQLKSTKDQTKIAMQIKGLVNDLKKETITVNKNLNIQ